MGWRRYGIGEAAVCHGVALSFVCVTSRILFPMVFAVACTASGPTPDKPVSDALRAKVCATDETDETSMIYLGRDDAGVVTRLNVTPMESLADAGNSIFDMDGKLLGYGTSGEIPWEDEAFVAKERARVAALMGGAKTREGERPLSCKTGAPL